MTQRKSWYIRCLLSDLSGEGLAQEESFMMKVSLLAFALMACFVGLAPAQAADSAPVLTMTGGIPEFVQGMPFYADYIYKGREYLVGPVQFFTLTDDNYQWDKKKGRAIYAALFIKDGVYQVYDTKIRVKRYPELISMDTNCQLFASDDRVVVAEFTEKEDGESLRADLYILTTSDDQYEQLKASYCGNPSISKSDRMRVNQIVPDAVPFYSVDLPLKK